MTAKNNHMLISLKTFYDIFKSGINSIFSDFSVVILQVVQQVCIFYYLKWLLKNILSGKVIWKKKNPMVLGLAS